MRIRCKGRAGKGAIIDEFDPLVGRRAGAPEPDRIGNTGTGFGDSVVEPSQLSGSGARIGWWGHAEILAGGDDPRLPRTGFGFDRLSENRYGASENHRTE